MDETEIIECYCSELQDKLTKALKFKNLIILVRPVNIFEKGSISNEAYQHLKQYQIGYIYYQLAAGSTITGGYISIYDPNAYDKLVLEFERYRQIDKGLITNGWLVCTDMPQLPHPLV